MPSEEALRVNRRIEFEKNSREHLKRKLEQPGNLKLLSG